MNQDIRLTYREPVAGIATPAIAIVGAVTAAWTGSWWALPLIALVMVGTWAAIAQRLDIESGTVSVYFLPCRRGGVTIPLSEARFTCDAVWLNISKLDGSPITRRRKKAALRAIEISGPSAVVQALRSSGIYVERTPTRLW